MTGILLSPKTYAAYREPLAAAAREGGIDANVLHLPEDPQARFTPEDCARVEVAYFTRDIRFSDHYQAFIDTVTVAPNLKWVHFPNAGVDQHPFLPALAARKVRLTTSAGSNGEPVGQTAIGGLLMLARNFPHWWAAQQRREWKPIRGEAVPRDLRGQTVLVIGMGTVGSTVARFCRVLGMHVIGVRRKPRSPDDPVDEMHPLAALPADSPLWDLPNVIVSPHNAQASAGNDYRAMQVFLGNLAKWGRGERMQNEESPA